MDFFRQFSQQTTDLYKRLSNQQRLMIGLVAVAIAAAIIGLVIFGGPSYGTLYSNLSQPDANSIVKKLQEKNIPYKLDQEGATILVPTNQVYELRLSMAGDGLPNSSIVGYEIFDRTNFGVSDQTQKLNRVRALEGELTRTILQIENVEAARVHIVLPEKRFFKEDQKSATASVWLKTRGSSTIPTEIAQGISHLVASSVEGLDASNVRIFDKRGILRSSLHSDNSTSGAIASNMDLKGSVEQTLSQKVQGMLDVVLGPGNSYVELSADIDFRQSNKTEEKYDPEDQVVRSEQVTEQNNTSGDTSRSSAKNINSSSTNSVTNYEIGKTVEASVNGGGDIKRLSVSVVVNGRYEDSIDANKQIVPDQNGEPIKIYRPLQDKQILEITELVKKQVGFSSDRNDQIAVANMQFFADQELFGKEQKRTFGRWCLEKIYDPNTWIMFALMIGALFLLHRLVSRVRFRKELETAVALQEATRGRLKTRAGTMAGQPTLVPGLQTPAELQVTQAEELGEEEMRAQQETRERVKQYFRDKPEEASSLLKVWLAENE